jgi:hypothetical protein
VTIGYLVLSWFPYSGLKKIVFTCRVTRLGYGGIYFVEWSMRRRKRVQKQLVLFIGRGRSISAAHSATTWRMPASASSGVAASHDSDGNSAQSPTRSRSSANQITRYVFASRVTPPSEGWRTVQCTRGHDFFDVVELWIEDTTLIEVLTPEMRADYLAFATPGNFRAFAAAPQ